MSHTVLKQRHSLIGKSLLPMILDFKNSPEVTNLARLKKERPLENYSLDELDAEFKKLTGENPPDVLMLVGKDYNLENLRQLMHAVIVFANTVGAPKGTQLAASNPGPSTASCPVPSTEPGQGSEAAVARDSSIEGRVRKMEESLSSLHTKQSEDKVTEALKNVRVLASRPKLTSPSVLIAALEVLVECAAKASHAETEYYTKALQTCRQYENHDDMCSLCLKLLGSSEDKKISSIIVDWAKTKKYQKASAKEEEQKSEKDNQVTNAYVPQNFPYPGFPFPMAMSMPGPYPLGPMFPPNFNLGRQVPRVRAPRPRRGACFLCKATGHFVNECPKLKKE